MTYFLKAAAPQPPKQCLQLETKCSNARDYGRHLNPNYWNCVPMCVWACVPWHTCGGQSITFQSWFFGVTWVPGIQLRSSRSGASTPHMCMHTQQKLSLVTIPNTSHLSSETRFLTWTCDSLIRLDWDASEPQEFTCLYSAALEQNPNILQGCWGSNSTLCLHSKSLTDELLPKHLESLSLDAKHTQE